jgi:phage-related tail fiber protein
MPDELARQGATAALSAATAAAYRAFAAAVEAELLAIETHQRAAQLHRERARRLSELADQRTGVQRAALEDRLAQERARVMAAVARAQHARARLQEEGVDVDGRLQSGAGDA